MTQNVKMHFELLDYSNALWGIILACLNFERIIGVFEVFNKVLKHFNHVYVLSLVRLGVFKNILTHHMFGI